MYQENVERYTLRMLKINLCFNFWNQFHDETRKKTNPQKYIVANNLEEKTFISSSVSVITRQCKNFGTKKGNRS